MNKKILSILLALGIMLLLAISYFVLPKKVQSTNVAVLSIQGGIVGYCDTLTIDAQYNGTIEKCSGQNKEIEVPESVVAELTEFQNMYKSYTDKKSDGGSNVRDGLTQEVMFYGKGDQEPTEEVKNRILINLNQVLNAYR